MERSFSIPFENKWLNKFNYTLSSLYAQLPVEKKEHVTIIRLLSRGSRGLLDSNIVVCTTTNTEFKCRKTKSIAKQMLKPANSTNPSSTIILTRARHRFWVFGWSVISGVAPALGHSLFGCFAVRRTRLTLVVPDAEFVLARRTNWGQKKKMEKHISQSAARVSSSLFIIINIIVANSTRRRPRSRSSRVPRLRFIKLPCALIAPHYYV